LVENGGIMVHILKKINIKFLGIEIHKETLEKPDAELNAPPPIVYNLPKSQLINHIESTTGFNREMIERVLDSTQEFIQKLREGNVDSND
jgi:hypothetical protein